MVKKNDSNQNIEISAQGSSSFKNRGFFSTGKLIAAVVVVVVLVGAYLYLADRPGGLSFVGQSAAGDEKAQARAVQKETEELVAKVGRHMILPEDEVPQIAEISDAALAAEEQPFYADAQDGDRLLVYLNLRKAIIYSPSRDLIVNVGPIYMEEDGTAQPTQQLDQSN